MFPVLIREHQLEPSLIGLVSSPSKTLKVSESGYETCYVAHLFPVWRTSTPEPTRGDGIIWTYLKDVTRFLPLFSKPGTFILQLDNLIQTGLDGEYASAYCILNTECLANLEIAL